MWKPHFLVTTDMLHQWQVAKVCVWLAHVPWFAFGVPAPSGQGPAPIPSPFSQFFPEIDYGVLNKKAIKWHLHFWFLFRLPIDIIIAILSLGNNFFSPCHGIWRRFMPWLRLAVCMDEWMTWYSGMTEEFIFKVKLSEPVAWLCYLFLAGPWASFVFSLYLSFLIWHGFIKRLKLDGPHKVLKAVFVTLNVQ